MVKNEGREGGESVKPGAQAPRIAKQKFAGAREVGDSFNISRCRPLSRADVLF
jgi:hypothetical protein